MKKEKVVSLLHASAQAYKKNLLNKGFLFIGRDNRTGTYSCMEIGFEPRHFMHLTGVKAFRPNPDDNIPYRERELMSSVQFFETSLHSQFRLEDLIIDKKENVAQKLSVLPNLTALPWTARMMGDYSGYGNFLYTEKIAGKSNACMGFISDPKVRFMIPNTALAGDTRNYIAPPSKQIIATYQKPIDSALYEGEPIYVIRGLKETELVFPAEIMSKLKK